jgi:hypothetical protein
MFYFHELGNNMTSTFFLKTWQKKRMKNSHVCMTAFWICAYWPAHEFEISYKVVSAAYILFFISLFDGCSVVLFKWSIFFRLLLPKFWLCFEFSYLIASMGLQLHGVLDLHALRSKKNLQNPVLVSLFVVGDRATIFSPSLVLNYNFHRSRCLWHGWRDCIYGWRD